MLDLKLSRAALISATVLLSVGSVMAQERHAQQPLIEPESVEALKKMGEHLQSLQVFSLNATTTTEVVLDTDQKLEIGGTATPATIKDTLEEAAQKYSLTFPLADLFSWGTPDAPIDIIREGFFVGHTYVNGKEADHWAFRGPDQDAEIWIATEGSPLPLKISLVDREDMARPRITSVLEWTENATIADDVFQYRPGEGAQKIQFLNEEAKQ
ncbi:UNVERIFIED_ORG: hypothetical protein QE446_000827 [Rhizobium sp. SORGH_AS260]|uniref:DUF2092 domain-containing protein n=1 Tax=Agrobacterium sp. SORGH_AS_0440 TaxID=3041757 RepID=UPI002781D7B0|nr:DUF2092 domain-containing protein [Agrobacterium sp. SORGH_AS_0440]MDP9730974.1 hypothetical protein [Rhizobium sp. SORGH_AS_0285]MDP9752970.1 hypothetical protein [Rhizobium sp. SORGH_AS_0260]MDR6079938.1 hypothetical protein [Agrobacterium sp. SORGH_AS_0440]